MYDIDLNLGKTTYRDEKPPTHNVRFTATFDDQMQALEFYTKLVNFVKDNNKETD